MGDTIRVQFLRLAFEPVALAGELVLPGETTTPDALDHAFVAFNRGSGAEIQFHGPSASVDDLFIITRNGDFRFKEVWQIESVGFKRIAPKFGNEDAG